SLHLSFLLSLYFSVFFNDTTPSEIYTLSLHDALPICHRSPPQIARPLPFSKARNTEQRAAWTCADRIDARGPICFATPREADWRSEEHTSELQSQSNLVCRLLLEKKKNKKKQNVRQCT